MFGNLNQLINFNYRKINQIDWNTFDCLQVVVVFVFFFNRTTNKYFIKRTDKISRFIFIHVSLDFENRFQFVELKGNNTLTLEIS